ncbi:MAG TPA: hypothetical protein VJI32_03405 [Candidatus Nanoarchaeia archaeon]|nr:hypothetical protein [Candidatus Nanoarchaeia archaeon]
MTISKIITFFTLISMMLSFAVAAEVTSPVLSTADAGMTPDSPFYFLDELFEQAGNDPEKALKYK